VKAEVSGLDRDLPLYQVGALDAQVEQSLWVKRLPVQLLLGFSVIALGLAAVGIYGVISYPVSQRTHEIGIRMALGAGSGNVVALMVRQGLVSVVMGLVIGLACAFALTRFMKTLLFDVGTLDPAVFTGITVLLSAVAFAACYLPARRATHVDPLVALRHE
jgi:putative ABC transport system permease protein